MVWDEFISNDRELFEAVFRALTGLRLIFVCIGYFRQILPVITNGNAMDTINACISPISHMATIYEIAITN